MWLKAYQSVCIFRESALTFTDLFSCFCFLVSISFISALIFFSLSLLLLTLGFVSPFSSFSRCPFRLFIGVFLLLFPKIGFYRYKLTFRNCFCYIFADFGSLCFHFHLSNFGLFCLKKFSISCKANLVVLNSLPFVCP